MSVFMHTSAFKLRDRPDDGLTVVSIQETTVGIIMDDLVPAGTTQRPLFNARDRERLDALMNARDAVNADFR